MRHREHFKREFKRDGVRSLEHTKMVSYTLLFAELAAHRAGRVSPGASCFALRCQRAKPEN